MACNPKLNSTICNRYLILDNLAEKSILQKAAVWGHGHDKHDRHARLSTAPVLVMQASYSRGRLVSRD